MTKTLVVSVCCVLLGIFSERATRVKEEGRMSIRAVVELSAIKGRDARVQAEWSGWIAEATSAELRDWWLREAKNAYEPDTVQERQVLKRWVERDRQGALEDVSRSRLAWGWLGTVIEVWAEQDLDDAIRFFSESQEWRHQFALLINYVPKTEVDRMLGLLEEFDPEMRQSILSQWAEYDVRYREALFRELEEGDLRMEMHLADWAEQDLQGLLEWARLPENSSLCPEVNLLRVKHEGADALRELWSSFDRRERDLAVQRVKVLADDYEIISRWAREHLTTHSEWSNMKRSLFSAWAEKPGKPERLVAFYEEWKDLGDPFGVMWNPLLPTIKAWAEQDSAALQAWALTLPEKSQLPIAKELLQRWLEDDASGAVPKLQTYFPRLLESGIEGNSLFPGPLTHEPTDRFVAAVETLPEEHRARQIEMRLKRYDQGAAEIEVLLEIAPDGDSKDRAIQSAVSILGQKDPEKAVAWANALSEGVAKEFAMRNAMRAFSIQAPEDSATWIEGRLASLSQEHPLALAEALERLVEWVPQRALDLAMASGQEAAFQAVLDKLPLTERNLQLVVSRSDLSPEQRQWADGALAERNFLKNALLGVR